MYWSAKTSSQLIDKFIVGCPLAGQSAGQRSLAHPQRPRHGLSVGFAVRQQLLHFALD